MGQTQCWKNSSEAGGAVQGHCFFQMLCVANSSRSGQRTGQGKQGSPSEARHPAPRSSSEESRRPPAASGLNLPSSWHSGAGFPPCLQGPPKPTHSQLPPALAHPRPALPFPCSHRAARSPLIPLPAQPPSLLPLFLAREIPFPHHQAPSATSPGS